jgi:hypothetical protein
MGGSGIRRQPGRTPKRPRRPEAVLDFLIRGAGQGLPAKRRILGLRFEATDLDWASGDGALVRGPSEALILVLEGKPAGLDDLEGEGVATLRARLT